MILSFESLAEERCKIFQQDFQYTDCINLSDDASTAGSVDFVPRSLDRIGKSVICELKSRRQAKSSGADHDDIPIFLHSVSLAYQPRDVRVLIFNARGLLASRPARPHPGLSNRDPSASIVGVLLDRVICHIVSRMAARIKSRVSVTVFHVL